MFWGEIFVIFALSKIAPLSDAFAPVLTAAFALAKLSANTPLCGVPNSPTALMRILALLPDATRTAFVHALTRTHRVLRDHGGARAAATAIRERECDALVLDPVLFDDAEFEMLLRTLKGRGVPVVLYTSLSTPQSVRRIVQAAEVTPFELVLREVDEQPELVAHKLASLLEPSAPALLLNRVASRFRVFPERLQTVAVSLFGSGPIPRWVDDVAHSSGLARRSVDRWMGRARLDGASTLLDTARMARVWQPFVERKLPLPEVALKCGYAEGRLLVAHVRRLLGVSPPELGTKFTRDSFAHRLADVLIA